MPIDFIDLRKGPQQPSWLTEGDKERTSRIFTDAWRMGQERQVMDLREREFQWQKQRSDAQLQMQQQALDIRNKSFEQEQTLHRLEIEKYQRAADVTIEQRKAAPALGAIYNQVSNLPLKWADPGVDDLMGQYTLEHPEGTNLPLWKIMESNQEKALSRKAQMDSKAAPNAADEAAIANQVADSEALDVAKGNPPWTPEKRLQMRHDLRGVKEFKPPLKGSLVVGPDGTVTASIGDENAPTVATASLAQKRILDAREFTSRIDDALQTVTTDAFGAKGKITDFINRTVGQINPEAVNLPVAQQRVMLGDLAQKQLAQYERMGRLTQVDRERILENGPTTGWFDSYERSVKAMQTMRAISKKSAAIDAKSAGMKVEDWMLTGLAPQDLTDLNKRGVLTKDEAIAAFKRLFPTAQ